MGTYRKRPVEIEAVKWEGDFFVNGEDTAPDWVNDAIGNGTLQFGQGGDLPWELFVNTLEGTMHCNVGDYIVKGVQGELYPCKGDIFEATYDESRGGALEKTIPLMTSKDYRDRFRAEYIQLETRLESLESMLRRLDAGELDFEPTCPKGLLEDQALIMRSYLGMLQDRAVREGVEL